MGLGPERDYSRGKGSGRFERKTRRPDSTGGSAQRSQDATPAPRRAEGAPQRPTPVAASPSQRLIAPCESGLSSRLFLPTTVAEMTALGWSELDILLVSGDAYVDHPSFGIPLLGRLLLKAGYRVGIIAQPRWESPEDIRRLGRPRLFCGIGAGCLDSMLSHYTAFRKIRRDDAYTPGGVSGARPNRASIVYTNLVRAAFPGLFVVLGGIEASLRRAAHYDFWSDSLRRSLLFDSKADLLMYGMGERGIIELARRLTAGEDVAGIAGTAYISKEPGDAELLPSYDAMQSEKTLLLTATLAIEAQVHRGTGRLAQDHGGRYVVIEPPAAPLSESEMDELYSLPFTRAAHPSYREPIPALEMVRWSVTAVRGCGGGCSFCSLALHQGRRLSSRSAASIIREVTAMTVQAGWSGTVSDIGGPTANLWQGACAIDAKGCRRASCLAPALCPHLRLHQREYLSLLRDVRALPGVRHVGIGSGIRYDAALSDPAFVDGLIGEFVSGHLKLAPEHTVAHVLAAMRKSDFRLFERFCDIFTARSKALGKEQYIVPYIISAFPGCTMDDMRQLAAWFQRQGWRPQQVQCFIPTPGTVATAMYYAGCDLAGRPLYVARSDREREDQHAVLFPRAAGRRGPASPPSNKARRRR